MVSFANYLHSPESGDRRKKTWPGARTCDLRSNAEFQPRKQLMWPRLFVSNCHIRIQARITLTDSELQLIFRISIWQ